MPPRPAFRQAQRQQREQQQRQADELAKLTDIVKNSSEKNRNFFIVYVILLVCLQAIIFSTTDLQLLLSNKDLKLPIIDLTMPVVDFYIIAPLFIVGLHFNFLQNLENHHYKLMQWKRAHPNGLVPRSSIYPFLFNYAILQPQGILSGFVRWTNNVLCYSLAPITLGLLLIRFSDCQDFMITLWHYAAFMCDIYLVWKLWLAMKLNKQANPSTETTTHWWLRCWSFCSHGFRYKLHGALGLLILLETLLTGLIASTSDEYFVKKVLHRVDFIPEWLLPRIAIDPSDTVWKLNGKELEMEAKLAGHSDWIDYFKKQGDGFKPAPDSLRLVKLDQQKLPRAQLQAKKLQGAYLQSTQLQGAYLQEAQLQGAHLREAKLQNAFLKEAKLQAADLWATQLQEANLEGAQLQKANLREVNLQDAKLQAAQLQQANLREAQLQGANLQSAQLQESNLRKARLQKANLREAKLQGAQLKDAQLQKAHLENAQLPEANLKEAQLQGAHLEKARLQQANLQDAQLQGTYLEAAQLQGADLKSAQLQGAHLQEAQLQETNLWNAQLQESNLWNAQLQGAYLGSAQLQGAYLRQAQLQGANLLSAQLQGADLREAQLQGADLSGAELQGAILDKTSIQGALNTEKMAVFAIEPDAIFANQPVDWEQLKKLAETITDVEQKKAYLKRINVAQVATNSPQANEAEKNLYYAPQEIAQTALPSVCTGIDKKNRQAATRAFRHQYRNLQNSVYSDGIKPSADYPKLLEDIDSKLCTLTECADLRADIEGLGCKIDENGRKTQSR